MADLPELNEWPEGIYQLETSDPVLGGPDGIDNLQAKQLASRTKWLKGQVALLGEGKQPLDATLTALASLLLAGDKLIYATGEDTFATTGLSSFIRTLLDDVDAAAALNTLKAAPLADPTFTGSVNVPNVAAGNSSQLAANTAFVQSALAALVASSPAALDTLNELAAALGNDPNFATTVTSSIASKVATSDKASQLESETGTDNTKWTTPLRVFQAIAKVVTQATEAAFGWAKIATQTQTNAGTDDATMVTPKKLRAGVVVSLVADGYIALPSWLGGLIFQWSKTPAGVVPAGGQSFMGSWPVGFPSVCYLAVACCDVTGSTANTLGASVFNPGKDGVGLTVANSGVGQNVGGVFFFGIGR